MSRWKILLLVLAIMTSSTLADEPAEITQQQLMFFETRIRPVLIEHCYECHSGEAKIIQGGLRVDSRSALHAGGDTGPAIVPGEVESSLLIKALRYNGIEMPPKGRLPDRIIEDLEAWIAMGAPDPREASGESSPHPIDEEERRKHWAFQPVQNPAIPPIRNASWPLDPLDHFILARLETAGLEPVSEAERHTWLRRVSLDLTGLPPTVGEIESFLGDSSPKAFETVVDRLLGSRAFGERWARHWLDLTGYADMMGTSNDVFAEHAWRYRDYLIAAYQNDKPYDRFIREQIAGDLIPTDSITERAENITATGFLMVGDVEIVEPDKAKMEADHIDTQVNKIGVAFLGMTLGCVRCHDHKFDPIKLSDYYGIAGMLRSSPSTHKIPFGVWSSLNTTELPETAEQLAARQALEAEHEQKLNVMKAERDHAEAEKKAIAEELMQLEQMIQPVADTDSTASAEQLAQTQAKKEMLASKRDELDGQIRRLGPAIEHAEFFRSKVPRAFAMHDGEQPSDMPIWIRGNPYAPGAIVPRAAIQVLSWDEFPSIPAGQSGRLQLANWLSDRSHPLTARVMVNRIWQKLFGEGIVRSVDYFGTRGEVPSHPELLDHLAVRFMDLGWSQKQLIRTIVLSRTYRLSSANHDAALQVDPDNRLLWRMNRQRLDAEAIRDSLLAVSGDLIASDGGPALVLEEVENCGSLVQQGVNPPHYHHRKSRPSQEWQRSIYLPVMRTNTTSLDRIRHHFDFVNPAQIAGQRPQTVAPTQALFVMNNELFRARAKSLADRLITDWKQHDERLAQLWLRVLGRPITPAEQEDVATFLTELEATLEMPDPAMRESLLWQELCHGLLASHEFVFRI